MLTSSNNYYNLKFKMDLVLIIKLVNMTNVSGILKDNQNYTTEMDVSGHHIIADEPLDKGGDAGIKLGGKSS